VHLGRWRRVPDRHDVGRVARREHDWRADGGRRHHVSRDGMSHGRVPVHTHLRRRQVVVLHAARSHRRAPRGRDVAGVDAGDVVDAGAAAVAVHGVEADEVLLRVAGHLRRRPRDDEVAGDATPVALAELVQPQQEQPESVRKLHD
jgi:hypothetical protein